MMFFQLFIHSQVAIPTSAFVRRGKVASLKVLEKYPNSFLLLVLWVRALRYKQKQFVCCMYGKPKYASVNKRRYDLFMQKFRPTSGNVLSSVNGIDLSLLPYCKDSLYIHIQRANYQAMIWDNSSEHYPEILSPAGHGWVLDDSGKLNYG